MPLSSISSKHFKIVLMGHHFLYLPLYFAEQEKFFNLLPKGYTAELVYADRRTDRNAYELLMDTDAANARDVLFAVCDPMEAFLEPHLSGSVARILASIVCSRAFWAVDRGSHRVNEAKDIGRYSRIIAYRPGTTSFRLATELLRHAGRDEAEIAEAIQSVSVLEEFDELRRSPAGVIALSPNVLLMEKVVSDKEFKREFSLSTEHRFDQILTTALITRADVLSQHQAAADGLVRAIQRATVMVRAESTDVLEYAHRRWGDEFGNDNVTRALERANAELLFPSSLEIRQSQWDAAVRSISEATGQAYADVAERSSRVFRESVLSCASTARHAFTEVMVDIKTPDSVAASPMTVGAKALGSLLSVAVGALFCVYLAPHFSSLFPALVLHLVAWALFSAGAVALWLPPIAKPMTSARLFQIGGALETFAIGYVTLL